MAKLRLLTALAFIGLQLGNGAKADSLTYLDSGKQALAHLAHELSNAKRSIDMTYFIFDPCSTSGRLVINLLKGRKAKIKNFQARLLIDAIYHEAPLRRKLTGALAKHGIQVRYYNATRKIPIPWATYRTHVKLTVVDGSTYLTGGRNISDDYFSLHPKFNFLDRDVKVTGSSVYQASEAFETLWNARFTFSEAPASLKETAELEKSCLVPKRRDREVVTYLKSNAAAIASAAPTVTCSQTDFIMDDPEFLNGLGGKQDKDSTDPFLSGERLARKRATTAVIDLIKNAKENLLIENWGYIPKGLVYTELYRQREVNRLPIEIFTNMLTDDNSVTIRHQTHMMRDNHGSQLFYPLSMDGSIEDRWEKTPRNKKGKTKWRIHSKVMTADGSDTLVGSFNIDPRSYDTNLEAVVRVRSCPQFANLVGSSIRRLETFVARDQKKCAKCFEAFPASFWDRLKAGLIEDHL